jgi:two-component system sensor histidine kinase KdpD
MAYVVRRVVVSREPQQFRWLRFLYARQQSSGQRHPFWAGYGAAILSVAAASGVIVLANTAAHIANISLVYLLPVLWLAAVFGRGPALLASALAFLAYDLFFIPPIYRFTVDDPTEWLSLFALLATALVLGQLTAAVQARAREARESQQHTEILYRLAQLIASTDQQALQTALTQRLWEEFQSVGMEACALILPDEQGQPTLRTTFPKTGPAAEALSLTAPECTAQAAWVLKQGSAVGLLPTTRQGRPRSEYTVMYLPLKSGSQTVGVLSIAGTPAIERFAGELAPRQHSSPVQGASERRPDPQVALFHACCDQIALALERATLQQQAIHAEALRESNHLKDVFLGSITHDLRTPLASIQAAASSLLEPGVTWGDSDGRELLESIHASSDRLNRLVSNLLDLSRLEAGVAEPQKDWHLIGEVVAAVLDQLELAGQLHDHQIHVELPDDLPLVPMDHDQMEQVLTNLLENALKYSPSGSSIRIRAQVIGPPRELEVQVADQGIGIPETELTAIFDKFYRVQQVRLPWTRMRQPTGTGLGLTICANIVRAHGGHIWAESRPGEGATFLFTLPIPDSGPESRFPTLEPPVQEPPPRPLEVMTS